MGIVSNLIFNSYSILLILILQFYSVRRFKRRALKHQLYLYMTQLTIFMLIIDVLSRLDGKPDTFYPVINHFSNFLFFLLNPVLPALWLLYVHNQIFFTDKKTKKTLFLIIAVFLVHASMVVANEFYGFFYYIDIGNIYYRGPLYILSFASTFFLLTATYTLLILNRKQIEKRYYFALLFFAIPPIIGTLMQIFIYGIPFALNGVVFSLLIVLLYIQDDGMNTDFLTGIANRMRFEDILNAKVENCHENGAFSLILLDLDNFKQINDAFGHEMGDNALKAVTKMLTLSVRSNDFIARFGGDEFCIVTDISNSSDLESAIDRINQHTQEFNLSSNFPFKISFSIGSAVYECSSLMTSDEFLKQVDLLMYENKKNKHRSQ
ncbi:MAG: diguanylate cyclase [Dethiosulfatibacter sp.]|nr:diguanylate cyclase [Dethiosulfatibacter sp.]